VIFGGRHRAARLPPIIENDRFVFVCFFPPIPFRLRNFFGVSLCWKEEFGGRAFSNLIFHDCSKSSVIFAFELKRDSTFCHFSLIA
jgi:hypothetical protein